jgi:3-hydroxyacyl-[acyl-carrier-protein] dehydratase
MNTERESEPAPAASSTGAPATAELAAIEAAIPHRAPFLLLTRVLARDASSIETEWRVPRDADWCGGHYPGEPILPGVLLCEHALQSGAVFVSHALGGFAREAGTPVVTRLADARFRRMVRPGELVRTRVELVERVGPAWLLSARSSVAGERALALRFTLSAARALAEATGGV